MLRNASGRKFNLCVLTSVKKQAVTMFLKCYVFVANTEQCIIAHCNESN